MGVATKPRFAVVFLMMLTLGMSVVLPAEDVLDAVYDESEALPFESIPLSSVEPLPLPARTTQPLLGSLHLNSPWWKSGYVRRKDDVIHRAAG